MLRKKRVRPIWWRPGGWVLVLGQKDGVTERWVPGN